VGVKALDRDEHREEEHEHVGPNWRPVFTDVDGGAARERRCYCPRTGSLSVPGRRSPRSAASIPPR